jgi:hypothetical protein
MSTYLSRFLLLALSGVLAGAAIVRAFAWSARYELPGFLALFALCVAISVAVAVAAIRVRGAVVTRLASELVLFVLALLVVEAVIVARAPFEFGPAQRARAAARLGVPFDNRNTSEVVADLQRQGVDALPGMSRIWSMTPGVQEKLPNGLYTLSHASDASVVECNESGTYLVYQTDEMGFNNPRGLLAEGAIDIGIVGESSALGHCVPAQDSLIGQLRRADPGIANFAMAGTLPLAQLASFREYVEPIRPPVVIWTLNHQLVYSGAELRNSTLAKYFDPGFSQNLRHRQAEVDAVVRELALPTQRELERTGMTEMQNRARERLAQTWSLAELRARIAPELRSALRLKEANPPEKDLSVLLRCLDLAHAATRSWGGQLIVLILPTYEEVVRGAVRGNVAHRRLARTIRERDIEVIDGVVPFEGRRDPASLFALRIDNHPNAEGYALLARHVASELERYMPQE